MPSEQSYRVEESAIRHAVLAPAEKSFDLESVIPLALGLRNTSYSAKAAASSQLITSGGGGGGKMAARMSTGGPGGDQLVEQLFRKIRIHRMAKIREVTGKTVDDAVQAVSMCAYLVHGVWVGCGGLYFKAPEESTKLPLHIVFDYLLSFFARDRIVDVATARETLKAYSQVTAFLSFDFPSIPINQSINRPINQSINQQINQSTNRSINQPLYDQSINRSILQLIQWLPK